MSLIFTRFCRERRIASVLSSSFFCLIFWNYLLIPTKSGKNVNCWLGREDEQIRAPPPLASCNGYLMMPVVILKYFCVQYEVFIQHMLFLSLFSTAVWLWSPVWDRMLERRCRNKSQAWHLGTGCINVPVCFAWDSEFCLQITQCKREIFSS